MPLRQTIDDVEGEHAASLDERDHPSVATDGHLADGEALGPIAADHPVHESETATALGDDDDVIAGRNGS